MGILTDMDQSVQRSATRGRRVLAGDPPARTYRDGQGKLVADAAASAGASGAGVAGAAGGAAEATEDAAGRAAATGFFFFAAAFFAEGAGAGCSST